MDSVLFVTYEQGPNTLLTVLNVPIFGEVNTEDVIPYRLQGNCKQYLIPPSLGKNTGHTTVFDGTFTRQVQEIREGHGGWRDGQAAECIFTAPAEVCEASTSLSQRRGGLTVIRHLAQYVKFKQR